MDKAKCQIPYVLYRVGALWLGVVLACVAKAEQRRDMLEEEEERAHTKQTRKRRYDKAKSRPKHRAAGENRAGTRPAGIGAVRHGPNLKYCGWGGGGCAWAVVCGV